MQGTRTEQAPLLGENGSNNKQSKALIASSRSSKPTGWLSLFSIRLLVGALVATIAFYASFGQLGKNQLQSLHPLDYAARTQRLLDSYGIFDGHNDLVCELFVFTAGPCFVLVACLHVSMADLIRVELKNRIYNKDEFPLGKGLLSHTWVAGPLISSRAAADIPSYAAYSDIPRLREGKMAGQFWSLYVPSVYLIPVVISIKLISILTDARTRPTSTIPMTLSETQ